MQVEDTKDDTFILKAQQMQIHFTGKPSPVNIGFHLHVFWEYYISEKGGQICAEILPLSLIQVYCCLLVWVMYKSRL